MAEAALFFDEAVAERASESLTGNLTFTFGWVLTVPTPDENRRALIASFGTNYKAGSCDWNLHVGPSRLGLGIVSGNPQLNQNANILLEAPRNTKMPGSECFFQYTIYGDDRMRYELCEFVIFNCLGISYTFGFSHFTSSCGRSSHHWVLDSKTSILHTCQW